MTFVSCSARSKASSTQGELLLTVFLYVNYKCPTLSLLIASTREKFSLDSFLIYKPAAHKQSSHKPHLPWITYLTPATPLKLTILDTEDHLLLSHSLSVACIDYTSYHWDTPEPALNTST